MKYHSKSVQQTAKIAKELAARFKNSGGIITLQGPLGAGKTTFTQSFAKALGITERITSPTFILARSYLVPNSDLTLHHLDLYRLESSVDLKSLSLDELTSDPNNLILIEWPEKIKNSNLLNITTKIQITILDPNTREFDISS